MFDIINIARNIQNTKIDIDYVDERLSLDEEFQNNPYSFFPNCPEEAKQTLESLINLRLSDMRFFPIGGWETIKGVNRETPKNEYKKLIKAQMQNESIAYTSYLDHKYR